MRLIKYPSWIKALSLICFLIAWQPLWAGERYIFSDSDLWNMDQFYYPVQKFNHGDEIWITQGEETLRFQLGKLLGEGTAGRVFELEGSTPPKVIKFQFGCERPRQMMEQELKSFKLLETAGIPHSKIYSADCRFYMIKERVQGETLDQIMDLTWHKLSPIEQTDMVLALKSFSDSIRQSSWGFNDLSGENIMYDFEQKTWKVVDAGTSYFGHGSPDDFLEFALDSNSVLETAFSWADSEGTYASWIESYLSLARVDVRLEDDRSEIAAKLFSSLHKVTKGKLGKSPKAYFLLWVRVFSKFAALDKLGLPQAMTQEGTQKLANRLTKMLKSELGSEMKVNRKRVLRKLLRKV